MLAYSEILQLIVSSFQSWFLGFYFLLHVSHISLFWISVSHRHTQSFCAVLLCAVLLILFYGFSSERLVVIYRNDKPCMDVTFLLGELLCSQ